MACSRHTHALLKLPSWWSRLPLLGYQECGSVRALELRNCTLCGSTLAVDAPSLAAAVWSDHCAMGDLALLSTTTIDIDNARRAINIPSIY